VTTGCSGVFDRPGWTGAVEQPAIKLDANVGYGVASVGGPVQLDGAEVRWAGLLDATVHVLVFRFRPPGGPGVACWWESSRCSSASPPS
jgi:hypothetical protein